MSEGSLRVGWAACVQNAPCVVLGSPPRPPRPSARQGPWGGGWGGVLAESCSLLIINPKWFLFFYLK